MQHIVVDFVRIHWLSVLGVASLLAAFGQILWMRRVARTIQALQKTLLSETTTRHRPRDIPRPIGRIAWPADPVPRLPCWPGEFEAMAPTLPHRTDTLLARYSPRAQHRFRQ